MAHGLHNNPKIYKKYNQPDFGKINEIVAQLDGWDIIQNR